MLSNKLKIKYRDILETGTYLLDQTEIEKSIMLNNILPKIEQQEKVLKETLNCLEGAKATLENVSVSIDWNEVYLIHEETKGYDVIIQKAKEFLNENNT